MCFVFISEQTVTCAIYSINWLIIITEMKSVYCTVQTGSLNKSVHFVFKGLNIVFIGISLKKWRPWNWGALYSDKNKIYCTFCVVYYENSKFSFNSILHEVWQTLCHSSRLYLRWCQLLYSISWWHKKKPRNTRSTCNLYLSAPHMAKGIW